MTTVIRACCPAGAERGLGYIETAGSECTGFGYTGAPGPVLVEINDPLNSRVEERTAWHEAAHAVVGFLAGWPLKSVSVSPLERVEFDYLGADREPWMRMVCALAGGAGEDARVSWYIDEPPESISDYVDRAFDFCGGQCDGCKAAMAAWQIVGFASSRGAAADQWRAAELEARRLCARADVKAAIAELVGALVDSPKMDGKDAEKILARHVRFGELKENV